MAKINDLLYESTITGTSSQSRPNLLALTRATTNLIYSDLVATQRTKQPVAAMYGVRYLNPNGDMSFNSSTTYGGQITIEQRKTIPDLDANSKDSFKLGDIFHFDDVIYKVIADNPFADINETDLSDVLTAAIVSSTIRYVSEAADTELFEGENSAEIAEVGLKIDKWQAPVKSRKLKTEITVELAQDLEANGFDAPNTIEDLLSTQMAEEINKDITQSLITVSNRFDSSANTPKGVLDLTKADTAPEQGRQLYRTICEMNSYIQLTTSYSVSYVLASAKCAAILAASGWLSNKPSDEAPAESEGILQNGMVVYSDAWSTIDYVIVGVTGDYGDKEMIGSLFYAPYSEGLDLDDDDYIGAYKIINDPDSLQPKLCLLVRYALSTNPYTVGLSDEEARVIDAGNFDKMAGRSLMSTMIGVKLPKKST